MSAAGRRGVGRPPAAETCAVRAYLSAVPPGEGVPVREVARSLQLSNGQAHQIVDRLRRKGEVVEVRRARMGAIKKPVCFYAAPEREGGEPCASMFDVLRFGIVSLD